MTRGIYLVANYKSQNLCENLIYSIRECNCQLPIRVIHFGGKKITSSYILSNVEYLFKEDFPKEAIDFVTQISKVLTDCPEGFLLRFLAFFHDWDEFLYSDNDIVALTNWNRLFEYTENYDLIHADEEYTTIGRFNYDKPAKIIEQFGKDALETAITAGHFVIKRKAEFIENMYSAISWYKENFGVAKKHDQAFLHIASLIGNWKMLNLCKPPHNWMSSWSGDYKNTLNLIANLNDIGKRVISHIHYSGSTPKGNLPIQDLLMSNIMPQMRLNRYGIIWVKEFLLINKILLYTKKVKKRVVNFKAFYK